MNHHPTNSGRDLLGKFVEAAQVILGDGEAADLEELIAHRLFFVGVLKALDDRVLVVVVRVILLSVDVFHDLVAALLLPLFELLLDYAYHFAL